MRILRTSWALGRPKRRGRPSPPPAASGPHPRVGQAPPSQAPPLRWEAPDAVSARGRPATHPGTVAEDARVEEIQREPRAPPEPGPPGLSSLRPAAVYRGQNPGTSGDPETLVQEVTSFGGGSKERPGRSCALRRREADGCGRRRKKRAAGE